MFYHEIYSQLNDFIKRHFRDNTISVVDLGCGDASQITKAFNCTMATLFLRNRT